MSFYVYTVLDADRRCLYVGQTNDVARRMKEHRACWPWARSLGLTVLTIEFATRAEALEAERWRIGKFRPAYNIHGNPRCITVEQAISDHEWFEEFRALNGLDGSTRRPPTIRERKRDSLALLRAGTS